MNAEFSSNGKNRFFKKLSLILKRKEQFDNKCYIAVCLVKIKFKKINNDLIGMQKASKDCTIISIKVKYVSYTYNLYYILNRDCNLDVLRTLGILAGVNRRFGCTRVGVSM